MTPDEAAYLERQRILNTVRDIARRYPETSDIAIVLRHLIAEIERRPLASSASIHPSLLQLR